MAKKRTARKKATPKRKPAARTNGRAKSLEDFTPDPDNARIHGERNRELISNSLREFGAGRSIVADADGVIRAGNGTLEEAKRLGLKARVIETDGTELVVVKRTDLKGAKAQALALADNRTSEQAEWDQETLDRVCADLQGSGFDLDGMGFSSIDLEGLGVVVPDFEPVDESEQSRLDQVDPIVCPKCGHEFAR